MKKNGPLLLAILAFVLSHGSSSIAAEPHAKRRLLFTGYGKAQNRFVELDGDGKLVWEFKPPSTTVIFQTLPNRNILFGYGGQPTGVREVDPQGKVVWEYTGVTNTGEAQRLSNGNTLIYCGTQKRLIEISFEHGNRRGAFHEPEGGLLPGTVIVTGTPKGVGAARMPPVFLQPGDTLTIEIEGIGALTNPVVAEAFTA